MLKRSTGTARGYDLHPDGLRVAMRKPRDSSQPQDKPVFVFNVFDEAPEGFEIGSDWTSFS